MTAPSFAPFRMPDFKSRPDGVSKSLKDAYVNLRQRGFPDKDIFIFPQGEFSSFKGEILGHRPEPGDVVSPGERITIIAAVPGICELMPDLFTDHRGDFHDEEFNARGGAKRLFAIFDSAIIKLLCRLEWIRDIYAGVEDSKVLTDYFSTLLDLPERKVPQISPEVLGYVLPSLYGYLGTEEAMRVYLSAVMGLESRIGTGEAQEFDLPPEYLNSIGLHGRLGSDFFLGARFKGAQPRLEINLMVESLEQIAQIIPRSDGDRLLRKILEFCVPQSEELFEINVNPDRQKIEFESGKSHLGFGTVLGSE